MDDLAGGMRRGGRRSLSRFLTRIETDPRAAEPALAALYEHAGRARTIGITGPPGAGKSTLVGALTAELRASGSTVAVLAVDPSSPLTGGALLGDRIRMQDHAQDPGVFVRSAGSRGTVGGLSAATLDTMIALDAFGFDYVLLETVGAGQDEVDVRHVVQTVVLVQAPGAGDGVQALKAGVLEVADCHVVNKCDLPGADQAATDLRTMIGLAPTAGWAPPVVLTDARSGTGVPELAAALADHQSHLRATGEWESRRRERARFHIQSLVRRRLLTGVDRTLARDRALDRMALTVAAGEQDPYAAAAEAWSLVTADLTEECASR